MMYHVTSSITCTQHGVCDLPVEPVVVCGALLVRPHPQVDFLEDVWGGTPEVDRSPADDESSGVGEVLAWFRQADGVHGTAEGHGSRKEWQSQLQFSCLLHLSIMLLTLIEKVRHKSLLKKYLFAL